jgi:hypothetical protein
MAMILVKLIQVVQSIKLIILFACIEMCKVKYTKASEF